MNLEGGSQRVVLKIPFEISPVKAAILPLNAKDNLPEKALEIYNNLKFDFKIQYDPKDSIGKRYRRQDAIGTPFSITIDYDTLKDETVTIRNRDTMLQERIPVDSISSKLKSSVSINNL